MAAVFSNLMPFTSSVFGSSRGVAASTLAPKLRQSDKQVKGDHMSAAANGAGNGDDAQHHDEDDGESDVDMPDADGDDYAEAEPGTSDGDVRNDDHTDDEQDSAEGVDGEDMKARARSRRLARNNQVKIQPARKSRRDTASDDSSASDSDSDSDASSATSSEVEAQWDRENPADEEADDEPADPSRFCSLTEDEDPGEEFELMLNCTACGDSEKWRCPRCVDNQIAAGEARSRRQSSAARILRELEPVISKEASHTIFANPVLDGAADAQGRSLRKRKMFEGSYGRPGRQKKRRQQEVNGVVSLPSRSVPTANGVGGDDAPSTPRRRSSPPLFDGTPTSRTSRLRQRKPLCSVLGHDDETYILSFNLGFSSLSAFRDDDKKRKRRDRDRARRARRAEEPTSHLMDVSRYPALQSTGFLSAFMDLHDRDGDLSKVKPYGGILTESEADTTRTFPQPIDRKKFESARLKAEELWKKKIQATVETTRTPHKTSGPPSRIKCLHFGGYEIDTWHSSPYPEEYTRNRVLHSCEFCLKYMSSDYVAWRHKLKCPARHPPGDEIYHDGSFSFFEVDGRKNPVYCQNLCLLAKLFLGSKTLYYDVEPFLFYVMTENDNEGCHFVGYFSKEKRPSSQNNVSCILVLPIHQRRGFGHMLIEFSYLLTRVEGKTGSPEKPLSDMGLVSYRNYWRRVLCTTLVDLAEDISITEISERTGMTADDIVCALEGLRALVRDPVTKTYALRLDRPYMREFMEAYEKKPHNLINPDALMWVPYVMGRDNSHYENTVIQTVAQREEEPLLDDELAVIDDPDTPAYSGTLEMQTSTSAPDRSEDDVENGAAATPFPALTKNERQDAAQSKASSSSTFALSRSTSDAHLSMGSTPIPPTRFEVFPPEPGTLKKKLGRPAGSYGRSGYRRGTPGRRPGSGLVGRPPKARASAAASPRSPTTARIGRPPNSVRRTRSALVPTADEEAGADMDADGDGEGRGDGGPAGSPAPEPDAADVDAEGDLDEDDVAAADAAVNGESDHAPDGVMTDAPDAPDAEGDLDDS